MQWNVPVAHYAVSLQHMPYVQQLGAGAVLQYNTANDNGKASHLEIER